MAARQSDVISTYVLLIAFLSALQSAVHAEVFVGTDQHISFRHGDRGVLPCTVDRRVNSVTWSKGHAVKSANVLIFLWFGDAGLIKTGHGYASGEYDINSNYSLIINRVNVTNNGSYFCEILDWKSGRNFVNHTDVTVLVPPRSPYPIIEECKPYTNLALGLQTCAIDADFANITCSVFEYFPDISLLIQHKSSAIEHVVMVESNNTDGTRDKSVTIQARASDEPYMCVVSDIPGSPHVNQTFTLFINALPDITSTEHAYILTESAIHQTSHLRIILPVVLVSTAGAVLILVLVLRYGRNRGNEINQKPTEVDEEFSLMEDVDRKGQSLQPDDILASSIALKELYREIFGKIKTSPLDEKSFKKLEQIYVNVTLQKCKRNEQNKDIDYAIAFDNLSDENTIPRLAIVGEAGVGKTTLLMKIAYDWSLGNHLTTIDLLFYVPLREVPNCLEDILKMYNDRGISLNSTKVEDYVKTKPRKVMLLLDGLDEYDRDIKGAGETNTLSRIISGDELKQCPVIVTTRPWRAHQITTTPSIDLKYSRIEVTGFKQKDVNEYITKFFEGDSESTKSLVRLVSAGSLVAQHMTPYPIFCSMLCNMWKKVSRRDIIQSLETFSQLLEEMVSSLTEHWLSKVDFRDYRRRHNESLLKIGKIALDGLLDNKVVFTSRSFENCMDAMTTGCEIGLLSSEESFALKGTNKGDDTNVLFPHKLLQEYLAGLYLAHQLVDPDHQEVMKEKILSEHEEFRYLLYFTVAHTKDVGYVRAMLTQSICEVVGDEEFIMDIAFEFHDKSALSPIVNYLHENCTELRLSQRLQMLQKHTWSGYRLTFAFCGAAMMESLAANEEDTKRVKNFDETSRNFAVGLITTPNLRLLELDGLRLDESFFRGILTASQHSPIQRLVLRDIQLGSAATKQCASGVFQLANLITLELKRVKVDDKFFSVMLDIGANAQIEEFTLADMNLGQGAAKHCAVAVLAMPKLRSLALHDSKLDYQFFSAMTDTQHESKISNMRLNNITCGLTTSILLAKGLSTLSKLHSLTLHRLKIDDKFFRILTESTKSSQVENLDIGTLTINRSALTSLLSLPSLHSLRMENVTCKDLKDTISDTEQNLSKNGVAILMVDGKSLTTLHNMRFSGMCPHIKELTLEMHKSMSLDVIFNVSSSFPELGHLRLQGPRNYRLSLDQSETFCKKLMTSYHRLNHLSFTDIGLGNRATIDIIGYLRHHKALAKMEFIRCNTDNDLDPVIAALHQEGKMRVTVERT